MRNGPFLLIPTGLVFICASLVKLLSEGGAWSSLGDLIATLAVLALPIVVIGLSAPPAWLMPTWYRRDVPRSEMPRDRFDWAVLAASIAGGAVITLAVAYTVLTRR